MRYTPGATVSSRTNSRPSKGAWSCASSMPAFIPSGTRPAPRSLPGKRGNAVGAFQVGLGVDARRKWHRGDAHGDRMARLEHAQLLQALELLELAGRQPGERFQ